MGVPTRSTNRANAAVRRFTSVPELGAVKRRVEREVGDVRVERAEVNVAADALDRLTEGSTEVDVTGDGVDEILQFAVLRVVQTGAADADESDRGRVGDVAGECDSHGVGTDERGDAGHDEPREDEDDGRAGRVRQRRVEDAERAGRPVVLDGLVRGSEPGDEHARAQPDADDERGARIDDDAARGRLAERRGNRRGEAGRDDAHHREDDDEQRGEDEQDHEQFGEQFEEALGALAGAVLSVAEHPALHPQVVPERVAALSGVFAELQEKRREHPLGGRVAGDAPQALVHVAGQRGGVENAPEGDCRLAVSVGFSDAAEHPARAVAPRREDVEVADRAGQRSLDVLSPRGRQPAEVLPGDGEDDTPRRDRDRECERPDHRKPRNHGYRDVFEKRERRPKNVEYGVDRRIRNRERDERRRERDEQTGRHARP
ncbi:hypothetical protein D320_13204 [Haloferax sp. BAB-2207]|nr:hypothetical protein D320_13204 [Haloferax sp. BAB-2207]